MAGPPIVGPLAIGLAGLLTALAALHLGWAFGLTWPAPKGGSLAAYASGGQRSPGRALTIAVAAAILAGAAVILAFRAPLAAPWDGLTAVAYATLTAVFLLRGAAGYLPPVWRYAVGTPFHRLNRLYYSPLCLLIGAGLVLNATLR
jgi:hypothetical protein